MKKNILISIVSPVYMAENIIDELVKRIIESVSKITADFEIILVEDGSHDNSWEKIEGNCKNDKRVKGIQLSRNFGQHYAISAGLDYAKGEWVVVMDCDLQDKPEEIIRLYYKALEGFDIVYGRRYLRRDNVFKRTASKVFYALFSYLTDTHQDSAVANFGVYHNTVINAVMKMGDYFRVFPILIQWVGFRKAYVDIEHDYRSYGKSNYNLSKLVLLAFDMIISFSEKPLKLGMKLGLFISSISFILGIYYLILYLSGNILVPGYTSLIITIAFSTGIIISFLGLTGLYIGKISIQVKNRPKYILKKLLLNCVESDQFGSFDLNK